MRSHLAGVQPPYRVPSNVLFFHDWRWLARGYPCWRDDDGSARPLFSPDSVPEMHQHYTWPSTPGLSIRTVPAVKTEPVLTPENTDMDVVLFGGNLIHEDGVYRLFMESWPTENFGTAKDGEHNLVRLFESDDGMTWRSPDVGLVDYRGTTRNNIVYGAPCVPQTGYHGGSVLKDPAGPPDERYKAFYLAHATDAMTERYLATRPDEVDPGANRKKSFYYGLFGAVSPDGLRWTPLPDPLLLQFSDTHNTCAWDPVRQTYVAYIRTWLMGRRTIGRTESADFRRFPLPENVLWPAGELPHTSTWYANAKTTLPGAPETHVMFAKRWDTATDAFTIHLAASPDNVTWQTVPGDPVLTPGERGAWDCGVVAAGCGLVDLPGDRIGVLYGGADIPHKYPRHWPLGAVAWATWEKDRLAALVCEAAGRFETHPLIFDGRSVVLNCRCAVGGHIRVGVVREGVPVEGRDVTDCDVISGNELARTVTWHGDPDIGRPEGKPVSLRVALQNAELFSIRFQ